MKTSSLSLSLLTATLFAVPLAAQDQPQAAAPDGPARWEKRHQEIIKRFDQDGDGRLSEDEKAAARAEMRKAKPFRKGQRGEGLKQVLKRFDQNGDGRLDDAERAEARKAAGELKQRREEIFRRFDQDGDGVLNEAERAEAQKAREEFLKQPRQK